MTTHSTRRRPSAQEESNGAKMGSAVTMDGREIVADEIASLAETKASLKCKHCGAAVSYVPPHAREKRGKVHWVKGYFRLLPKCAHGKTSVFDVFDEVEVIARRSLGLLQALEQERYSFRLLAFDDVRDLTALRSHATLRQAIDATHRTGPLFSRDLRGFLSAYFNTAKRVISLRALCGDDGVLTDRPKLVFNGTSVCWNDFYYEEERFLAAYRWIGQTTVSFPVALVGHVSAIQTIPRKNRSLYVLKLESPAATPRVRGTNVGELTQVEVWTSRLEWLRTLDEGDKVLVFGHWRHAVGPTHTRLHRSGDRAFRKNLYRRMSIWLYAKSQISKICGRAAEA
ncbi:hypothetical protein AWB78_05947 [Caballeronia calidae]|uniref:Uncharacterized protein n=2 Tax=Caballeronia calidae TaxID=1777139 RepID=A0A158E113_9BURK|nr:hypothetical protein AWB78_05947 [Caballeronia calidae]